MKIQNIKIIHGQSFKDDRGEFYCSLVASKSLLPANLTFKEWDFSYNFQNVLRGLHCDFETWKLVECVYGEVFWVAADARRNSTTFKNIISVELTGGNHKQILVPPGVLTGFYVRSQEAIFYYRQTNEYSGSESQISVIWNDPQLAIKWPCSNPKLSERDCNAGLFEAALSE